MIGFVVPMFCIECIFNRMHALFALYALETPLDKAKNYISCQYHPHTQSLELECRRQGGHPDWSLDAQDTCHHSMKNFC